MQAVIGKFYKQLADALTEAERMKRTWKGRVAFYVIEAPNGCMVISESQARKLYPDIPELRSNKNRRYGT